MKKGLIGGITLGAVIIFSILCAIICIERVPVGGKPSDKDGTWCHQLKRSSYSLSVMNSSF